MEALTETRNIQKTTNQIKWEQRKNKEHYSKSFFHH
ncbi:hypothetical protein L585_04225 [Pantoea ananatis BRT175]|nr:hypothetical protein L585_04225 [Pantoea ananatis BRT175]